MGTRHSTRRSVWLGAALALAVAGGACASPSDARQSAGTSESYVLSDFKLTYPYDDPRRDVGPQHGRASAVFTVSWPSSGFPGFANCILTLESGSGEVVGEQTFQLISGTNGARNRPVVVPVTGAPDAARGSCTDDGSDDFSGNGYLFTGPTRIWKLDVPDQGPPGRDAPPLSQVEFEVTLERPGRNPGMRTCYLFVTWADGTEDPAVEYGMLIGEGPVVFDVEGEPETIASARVTCEPFEA